MSKATKYCVNCGTQIDFDAEFCPKCGVRQPSHAYEQVRQPYAYEHVSSAWYAVPFFFLIIGGLIAWVVNKDRDPKKARNFVIFGIVWTILIIVAYYMLIFIILGTLLSSLSHTYI